MTGTADCEDYAIAKYVALREAGVTDDDLRLMIVHDSQVRQDPPSSPRGSMDAGSFSTTAP